MSIEPMATASEETVATMDGPDGPLVGIVTWAGGGSGGKGVILCPGGWYGTTTNNNRLYVRLARRLAAAGYSVLRFDWHGVGESGGEIDRFELAAPFSQDVVATARYLEARGVRELALVGVCFGARSALAAADEIPSLRSLALVSFPVPQSHPESKPMWLSRRLTLSKLVRTAFRPAIIRGLFDRKMRAVYWKAIRMKWRSLKARAGRPETHRRKSHLTVTELERQLKDISRRGISTLFLFGEGDLALQAWIDFRKGRLSEYLEKPGSLVRMGTVPGDVYGFDTLGIQEVLIERIMEWIVRDQDRVQAAASTEA